MIFKCIMFGDLDNIISRNLHQSMRKENKRFTKTKAMPIYVFDYKVIIHFEFICADKAMRCCSFSVKETNGKFELSPLFARFDIL